MNALTTIDFHGAKLVAIAGERPENTLVAMKPIVEGMGLDWGGQHKKMLSHPILNKGISVTEIPSAGGSQEATCLSLDLLNFWLATIHPDRLKDEVRATVIRYQTECARVLFNHFFGKVFDTPQPTTVIPPEAVTLYQTLTNVGMTAHGMTRKRAVTFANEAVAERYGIDFMGMMGIPKEPIEHRSIIVERKAPAHLGPILVAISFSCGVGRRLFTTAEVIGRAVTDDALNAALGFEVRGPNGKVCGQRLGMLFAYNAGRVVRGLCILNRGLAPSKSRLWAIDPIAQGGVQ